MERPLPVRVHPPPPHTHHSLLSTEAGDCLSLMLCVQEIEAEGGVFWGQVDYKLSSILHSGHLWLPGL